MSVHWHGKKCIISLSQMTPPQSEEQAVLVGDIVHLTYCLFSTQKQRSNTKHYGTLVNLKQETARANARASS